MLRYVFTILTPHQGTCSFLSHVAPVRFHPRHSRQPFISSDSHGSRSRVGDEDGIESYDHLTETDFESDNDIENAIHAERNETARRAWVKKKILHRKYFLNEPELNLLSWAAKEQIRHLHAKDPNEWNVVKLAQSFPISENGVMRVLRSNYFRSESEVVKHDTQVRKNWKTVKLYLQESDGDVNVGGPLENTMREIMSKGKLPTMLNAGGMDSVVIPPKRTATSESDYRKKEHVGLFESIVKDYVDHEKQKLKKQDSKEKFVSNCTDDSILADISQMDRFDKADDIQESRYEVHPTKRESYERNTIITNVSDAEDSQTTTVFRRTRKPVQGLESIEPLERINLSNCQVEKLGMLDTGRTDEPAVESSQPAMTMSNTYRDDKEDEIPSQTRGQDLVQRFADDRQEVLARVRYEKSDEKDEVAYLYDYKSGYHHPLGETDEKLNNLDIPDSMREKGDLYQQGNYVYDGDGEFLYKIP